MKTRFILLVYVLAGTAAALNAANSTRAPAPFYLATAGPALPMPPGPTEPTWDSLHAHYAMPAWNPSDFAPALKITGPKQP